MLTKDSLDMFVLVTFLKWVVYCKLVFISISFHYDLLSYQCV